jgi:hypothetical protein
MSISDIHANQYFRLCELFASGEDLPDEATIVDVLECAGMTVDDLARDARELSNSRAIHKLRMHASECRVQALRERTHRALLREQAGPLASDDWHGRLAELVDRHT